MDYIILNNDGSLNKQSLTRYINQGSHGVDKIFIGWASGLTTDYLQAVFTLPNQMTNTVLGEFEENYNYDGEHTINGWVITLTDAQTTYKGLLMVSARIIRSGIVQVAYPFTLCINETGVTPETDSGLTIAQIDSYLLNLQTLITGAVQANTDAVLSNTSENPVQNKVVTAAIETLKRGSYTKVDTTEYPTLADFLDSEGEEGYLYLYPVDVNDEDEGYYQYIWENEQWIPLGTTKIDIANMVTTDTSQTITGEKTLQDKPISFYYTGATGNAKWHIEEDNYGCLIISRTYNSIKTTYWVFDGGTLNPYTTNVNNLGSSSKVWSYIYVNNLSNGSGDITSHCNFKPSANNSLDLGSSSLCWQNVYAYALYRESTPYIQLRSNDVNFTKDLIGNSGTVNLGTSTYPWKDLYLSGKYYLASDKYIYLDSSNRIVFSNNGDRLKIDSSGNVWYVANAIPLITNSYDLGSASNAWKSLYTRGFIVDGDNGQNKTIYNIVPNNDNTQNLGGAGKKFLTTYTRYINDDSVNIAVSDIATKVDTTENIDLGTFDANGEITYSIATLEQDLDSLGYDNRLHGMYMLTYGYAQAIIYLDKIQLEAAASMGFPIRAPMPVVYNAINGYSVPGNVRVQKVGTNYVFKVSDGNQNAAQGLHLYLIPTDLIK